MWCWFKLTTCRSAALPPCTYAVVRGEGESKAGGNQDAKRKRGSARDVPDMEGKADIVVTVS